MIFVCYLIACLMFAVSFAKLSCLLRLRNMMQIFESARSVVGKADLTDLEKEKRMRSLAIKSIKAFMSVLLSLAAVAATTIISAIAVAALTGVDTDALIDFSLNPVVLLLTVAAVSIAQWAFRRRAK